MAKPVDEKNVSDMESKHVEESGSQVTGETPELIAETDEDDFHFGFTQFFAIFNTLPITSTSAILLPIKADIGPSSQYTWVANAQKVGSAALAPFTGRLSDIFGRRYVFMLGSLFSLLGNVLCATAKKVNIAICGGVFIGCAIACHQLGWTAISEVGRCGNNVRSLLVDFIPQIQTESYYTAGLVAALIIASGAQAIVSPGSNVVSTILVVIVNTMVGACVLGTPLMLYLRVRHEYLRVVTSILTSSRSVGESIATAIYATMLTNEITKNLANIVAHEFVMAGLPLANITGVITTLVAGDPTAPALQAMPPSLLKDAEHTTKKAWAKSFRVVYLISIAFGILGTSCAAFSRDVYSLYTIKVDVQLDTARLHAQGHHEQHPATCDELPIVTVT
ncbi:uncharacterized protein A1O9_12224 [Exophiala aquamarina CBS 119918]|uniref:Major facilitator superfamily (MFS) profile domain-containing protein n=1 Tax=Exophiala aquamarina CBS 119918 TaxID=1182545 RepID=A0A072NUN2_9EURO|nr:uncharacterized protein A1O9_12224 [Exophiala aquamarina CBS 119918]KEF51589.1 hypothetical protein A1O9_12224 [Exophiala aquamarina CBS 119918]